MATAWNPTSSHPSSGGGGFSPVQATYTGASISIGNGAQTNLPFTTLYSGTELLSRTDPANPSFLAAGTYAVSVAVYGDALTAGGFAAVVFGINFGVDNETSAGQGTHPPGIFGASGVLIATAGAALFAGVMNGDGVAARHFQIDAATIVRLA